MYIIPKINIVNNENEKESFFCTICNSCLLTDLDHKYHKEYSGCEACYYQFVESIKNSWDKNNSVKQIDKKKLKEYIYLRNKFDNKKVKLS